MMKVHDRTIGLGLCRRIVPERGVPLMVPLLASNLSPGGNPTAVHEYGGVPPVAVSVVLYATPCVASGIDVVVMESGPPPPPPPPPAALTVMLSDTGAVVFAGVEASVACTVKVLVPVRSEFR